MKKKTMLFTVSSTGSDANWMEPCHHWQHQHTGLAYVAVC